jgi:hypothetical protein
MPAEVSGPQRASGRLAKLSHHTDHLAREESAALPHGRAILGARAACELQSGRSSTMETKLARNRYVAKRTEYLAH